MSQGIEKDTYVKADEKTTKALTYDLLDSLSRKIDDLVKRQSVQFEKCNVRFNTIENSKRKNIAISGITGVGGGSSITALIYYIKELFIK